MTTKMSYTEARQNLASVLDRAVHDREPVIITRRGSPNAVVLAEDEYRSLMETVYLLRTPANARRIFDAIDEADRGEGIVMTMEELRAMVEAEIAGEKSGAE